MLGGDVEERLLPGDPRVVDQDVDALERAIRIVHEARDVFVATHVTRGPADPPEGAQVPDRLLDLGGVDATEEDAGLLLEEAPGGRATDAAAAAAHENAFVPEASHGLPSLCDLRPARRVTGAEPREAARGRSRL